MQQLHLEYKDGSVDHVEFSRKTWEQFYGDPSVQSQWTHHPHDCHYPASRLWARLRREGYPQTIVTHALADREDPDWVGDRSGKIQVVSPISDRELVIWPPTSKLTAFELHSLSHLSVDDAYRLWLPELVLIKTPPKVNKVGQWSLF